MFTVVFQFEDVTHCCLLDSFYPQHTFGSPILVSLYIIGFFFYLAAFRMLSLLLCCTMSLSCVFKFYFPYKEIVLLSVFLDFSKLLGHTVLNTPLHLLYLLLENCF
jgi:hypothetical protein